MRISGTGCSAAAVSPHRVRAPGLEAMGRNRDDGPRRPKPYLNGVMAYNYFSTNDYWALKKWMPMKIERRTVRFWWGFQSRKSAAMAIAAYGGKK